MNPSEGGGLGRLSEEGTDGLEELAGAGVLGGAALVEEAQRDGDARVGDAAGGVDSEELVYGDVGRFERRVRREPQPQEWKVMHSTAKRILQ